MSSRVAELDSPALCLNAAVWQQRISAVAEQVRQAGKIWRPRADWHLIPQLSRWQISAGASGIALDSVAQVESFLQQGLTAIHLSRPPAAVQPLRQLFSWSNVNLSVSCDHYAQAEQISGIACTLDRCLPVLIELNVGLNWSGVRPGLDGRDLARGISRLRGVEIRGLDINLGTITGTPAEERRISSAMELLAELQHHFQRDGIACETVSVALEGDIDSVLAAEIVTECRTGNFFNSVTSSGERTMNSTPPTALSVLASVFSRPKLERGVVDVGHSRIGHQSAETLSVQRTATSRPLPDVMIDHLGWDSITLNLGPGSRDLIIGDQIFVELFDGALALRLFPELHVIQEGIVRDIWPTVAG